MDIEDDNISEIHKSIETKEKEINETSLWRKVSKYFKNAGVKVIYTVLLMFYAYKRKDTPVWAKRIILGAIGYFMTPIDLLPDLTPVLGYTDDLGVLSFGLVMIAAHVNKEVKEKARGRLTKWFGEYDEKELEEVDKQL